MSLTRQEQEELYLIISTVLGEDQSIRNYTYHFNDQTIEIVEEVVTTNAACNQHMKALVTDLLGAGSTMSKGWLKRLLKSSRQRIKQSTLHGYGCMVSAKRNWKTAIIGSTL